MYDPTITLFDPVACSLDGLLRNHRMAPHHGGRWGVLAVDWFTPMPSRLDYLVRIIGEDDRLSLEERANIALVVKRNTPSHATS